MEYSNETLSFTIHFVTNPSPIMFNVISKQRFVEFGKTHPEARNAMLGFHRILETCKADNFAQLKLSFGSVDKAGKFTVFDVSGNKYRVVAVIHYDTRRIYVRGVFTHSEYDNWNEDNRGK
jgi:mRNA interferase HigB